MERILTTILLLKPESRHFLWRRSRLQINPQLSECYEITYVFKPYDPSNLDIYESQWILKLKAKININKTIFSVM